MSPVAVSWFRPLATLLVSVQHAAAGHQAAMTAALTWEGKSRSSSYFISETARVPNLEMRSLL